MALHRLIAKVLPLWPVEGENRIKRTVKKIVSCDPDFDYRLPGFGRVRGRWYAPRQGDTGILHQVPEAVARTTGLVRLNADGTKTIFRQDGKDYFPDGISEEDLKRQTGA